MMCRSLRSLWMFLCFGTAFMMGCGSGKVETSVDDGSQQKQSREEIEIALNWIPDSQHGGFFAAQVHGYFAEEGLQVKISSGGPNAPVVQKVALGRAQFGIGNADQILLARQQEADIVALFAAMQNSPRCIMVHEESGIESFDQLNDVTLAVGAGKAFVKYMQAKLPLRNVKFVPYTGSIVPFLNDHRFAQQAYVFSEPYVARSRGAKPRCLMVSELGFNPYSSCLFVNGQVLRERPDMVRRVTRAVSRGWQRYLENPEETNVVIQQRNPEMDLSCLKFGAEAIAPLCRPNGENGPIGGMDDGRWRRLAEQLVALNFLESADSYSSAYRTDFLP